MIVALIECNNIAGGDLAKKIDLPLKGLACAGFQQNRQQVLQTAINNHREKIRESVLQIQCRSSTLLSKQQTWLLIHWSRESSAQIDAADRRGLSISFC